MTDTNAARGDAGAPAEPQPDLPAEPVIESQVVALSLIHI